MTIRDGDTRPGATRPTRRRVLAAVGAAGLAGLAGCGSGSAGGGTTPTRTASQYANYPVSGETVTVGVSVPRTGVFATDGEDLLTGYRLAARDLEANGGLVRAEAFPGLTGDRDGGILGRSIDLSVADSGSQGDQAERTASALIDSEGATVLTGGASTAATRTHQSIAADRGVIYMGGSAPGAEVTGAACSTYGFHEMFNGKMAAEALGPVLESRFGADASYARMQPDSVLGDTLGGPIRAKLSVDLGWTELASSRTRVGSQDLDGQLRSLLDEDPDVLVLGYYGLDGASILTAARDLAGEDVGLVVPIYNRPMAENAGGAIEGVVGTVPWDVSISSAASRVFTQAYADAFDSDDNKPPRPSGLVHLAYVQLLQYAAAVERADTFEPPTVVSELEGVTYDAGLGEQELRACDHRARRPVPVVTGLPAQAQYPGRYYELDRVVTDVTYACDESPASACRLG